MVSRDSGVLARRRCFPSRTKLRVVAIAKDPRVGTGKKPKGSGRRLYTDENPKDTVRIKYATPADARATARKVKKINKPYARKIQILTVMEQRSKYGGKPQQAGIAKRAKQQLRNATKKRKIRICYLKQHPFDDERR